MPKFEEPKINQENLNDGLEYPTENEAGFEGLMSGQNPDFVDEKTEKQIEQERILIEYIKQLIIEGKVAQHSAYELASSLINRIGYQKKSESDEKDIRRDLNKLNSYFKNGILSHRKIDNKEENDVMHADSGFGPLYQDIHREVAASIIDVLSFYLDRKKKEGVNLEELDYDEVINDEEFTEILFHRFLKESSGVNSSEREIKRRGSLGVFGIKSVADVKSKYNELKRIFLDSPQMRFAFNRLRKEGWSKRWSKNDNTYLNTYSYRGSPSDNMADLLFGRNLISSYSPESIRDYFEKNGKLNKYEYDALSILFKVPDKARTHELLKNHDLGIINRIPLKDFVTVIIDQEVGQLPQEILDAIPENIPVITTDFKVIRMPKENNLPPTEQSSE